MFIACSIVKLDSIQTYGSTLLFITLNQSNTLKCADDHSQLCYPQLCPLPLPLRAWKRGYNYAKQLIHVLTMVFQVVCCLPTLCLQEDKHRQQVTMYSQQCRITEKIDHVKYPFSTILPSCISYIVRPQFIDFYFLIRCFPCTQCGRAGITIHP